MRNRKGAIGIMAAVGALIVFGVATKAVQISTKQRAQARERITTALETFPAAEMAAWNAYYRKKANAALPDSETGFALDLALSSGMNSLPSQSYSPGTVATTVYNAKTTAQFAPNGNIVLRSIAGSYKNVIQQSGQEFCGEVQIGKTGTRSVCLRQTAPPVASGPIAKRPFGVRSLKPGSGPDEEGVLAMAEDPVSKKVYIGGFFDATPVGPRTNLARLNADGTFDPTFALVGTGFNKGVNSISIDNVGNIYVTGDFTSFNGVARMYVAKLKPDGTLDTSFNPAGIVAGNYVEFAAWSPFHNMLYVQGLFPNTTLRRYKPDGTIDTAFNFPVPIPMNSYGVFVSGTNGNRRLIVDPTNGKPTILEYQKVTRLSATGAVEASSTFTVNNGYTFAIARNSTGHIFVTGSFTGINGAARAGIMRLNGTTLAVDTAFPSATPDAEAYVVMVDSADRIYLGGWFDNINGTPAGKWVRLTSAGARDPSFDTSFAGFNRAVRSILPHSTGIVFVGGGFQGYGGKLISATWNATPVYYWGGTGTNGIAVFSSTGAINLALTGTGVYGTPQSMAFDSKRNILYVTGYVNGVLTGVARLLADGTWKSTLPSPHPWAGGCTTVNRDTGDFYGLSRPTIYTLKMVRYKTDGTTLDPSFGMLTTMTSPECHIDAATGKIYERNSNMWCGPGSVTSCFNRYNADGTQDYTFPSGSAMLVHDWEGKYFYVYGSSGTHSKVYGATASACCTSAGEYYVAGSINTLPFGYGTAKIMGKVDSSGNLMATWVPPAFKFNGVAPDALYPNHDASGTGGLLIEAMAMESDTGKIYVGGNFTEVNGTPRKRLARLNADGTLDTTFNPGVSVNGKVTHLLYDTPRKKLFVGGEFNSYQGILTDNLIRLKNDGTIDF